VIASGVRPSFYFPMAPDKNVHQASSDHVRRLSQCRLDASVIDLFKTLGALGGKLRIVPHETIRYKFHFSTENIVSRETTCTYLPNSDRFALSGGRIWRELLQLLTKKVA
jgi:hypothetical protein